MLAKLGSPDQAARLEDMRLRLMRARTRTSPQPEPTPAEPSVDEKRTRKHLLQGLCAAGSYKSATRILYAFLFEDDSGEWLLDRPEQMAEVAKILLAKIPHEYVYKSRRERAQKVVAAFVRSLSNLVLCYRAEEAERRAREQAALVTNLLDPPVPAIEIIMATILQLYGERRNRRNQPLADLFV